MTKGVSSAKRPATTPAGVDYRVAVAAAPTDPVRREIIEMMMLRGRWIEADWLAAAWLNAAPGDIWAMRVRAYCAIRRFDYASAKAFCHALQAAGPPAEFLLTPVIAAQLTFGDVANALRNARIALTHPEVRAADPELLAAAVEAAVVGGDVELLRVGLERAATGAVLALGRRTINDARQLVRRAFLDALRARLEVM